MMLHKKFVLVAACVAVFVCLSGIGWALVNSQFGTGLPIDEVNESSDNCYLTPEELRDEIMDYVKANHPETEQFIEDLIWSGGKEETRILGAEIYNFESEGWKVSISFPIIPNPIYDVTVNYSVPAGVISVIFSILWEGTCENGATTENNYVFAQ